MLKCENRSENVFDSSNNKFVTVVLIKIIGNIRLVDYYYKYIIIYY